MSSNPGFENDVLNWIGLVDEEFYHSEDWIKIQAFAPAVIGVGFGLWATYVFYRFSFGGVPLDTYLVVLGLVIATDTLTFSLVYSINYAGRFRRMRAETHFNKLKNKVSDALVLAALVKMKACLPNVVTLRSVYDREKSVFTLDSLVRRALEPLQ